MRKEEEKIYKRYRGCGRGDCNLYNDGDEDESGENGNPIGGGDGDEGADGERGEKIGKEKALTVLVLKKDRNSKR